MGFSRFALNDDWAIDIAATQFEQWLAALRLVFRLRKGRGVV